jgi:hypothetical protein
MAEEIKIKLIPLSRIRPTNSEELDTVAHSKKHTAERRAWDVLREAEQYWQNMDKFRRDRERAKRYCFGDQWRDIISVDGKRMSEEQYIKSQGNVPLKNNLIRRLVRNVLGVYRGQSTEPTCTARDRKEQNYGETMSTVLQYNMQLNRAKELNARSMEEFLISGLVVQRKWYGWRNNKMECWTDYVQPNNFFIDSNMRDFRGWDVSCVGEIHDVSFNALAEQFAKDESDYQRLAEIYRNARDSELFANAWHRFGYDDLQTYDFFVPFDTTRCRVIEVWRKESKPRYRCHDYNTGDFYKIEIEDYDQMVQAENQDRLMRGTSLGMSPDDIPLIQAEWFMDNYWYYYYLSPFGDILAEGETPYQHGSHPYVFKPFPFIDGEIHSFVSDVIDQQRYTNRLITMYDWIMRASAKGVLLFPEECLPDGYNMEDIADEWSRFNGVIMMKTKNTAALPQQIANNSTNIGIAELLNIQLKLFEDISGVNGALQGKPGYSGISAALYSQQTQNATTSLLDLLDCYSQFLIDAAYKDVKNIQQFYDVERIVEIAGEAGISAMKDPQKIQDIEFDLSIVESTSTPTYRAMTNDLLLEIWRSGQISLQQMLEVGSFPFADALLQSLQSQEQQIEKGQAPQGISPELMQQAQQGANMQAVQQGYNAITGRTGGQAA